MSWLKDCLICNTGLCKTVDEYKDQGLSENAGCKQMSEDSDGLYSKEAIRNRYKWHTGKVKRNVGENHQHPITRRRRLTDDEKEAIISEEFQKGFDALLFEIKNAKHSKWKTTSKEAAIKRLEVLYDVVTH